MMDNSYKKHEKSNAAVDDIFQMLSVENRPHQMVTQDFLQLQMHTP